ncbi:creatininase family protein [Eubacteriaceae bacterium ES2]|nr:creatininase family protein [Eubacteriaceae bacterium ES2]
MRYSIFEHTMVDMPYNEVEKIAANGGSVLFPISVVEEHGPHLCTGTDIYLTQAICQKISFKLKEMGLETIIAPPFYWGINSMTNGFIGSFEIKPQTMITLILEICENFRKWGFEKIILINFHGDFAHIKTIAEAAKQASVEYKMPVYFANEVNQLMKLGYTSQEPYFIRVLLDKPFESENKKLEPLDIHAGGFETSWMIHRYRDLVNIPLAHNLKPSNTGLKELSQWSQGGEVAKKLTPLGYFGNPSDIDLEKIDVIEKKTVEAYANAIKATFKFS